MMQLLEILSISNILGLTIWAGFIALSAYAEHRDDLILIKNSHMDAEDLCQYILTLEQEIEEKLQSLIVESSHETCEEAV